MDWTQRTHCRGLFAVVSGRLTLMAVLVYCCERAERRIIPFLHARAQYRRPLFDSTASACRVLPATSDAVTVTMFMLFGIGLLLFVYFRLQHADPGEKWGLRRGLLVQL